MEANQILSADILDIIFERQNKDYGAYQLRRGYEKRMQNALTGTAIVCGLLLALYYLDIGPATRKAGTIFVTDEIHLRNLPDKQPDPTPIPKIKQPQAATVPNVTIRIVRDDVVPKQDVPTVDEMENARISTVRQEGVADENAAPPAKDDKGVVGALQLQEPEIFETVEIESSFPGGMQAWTRYLIRNLQYPVEAVDIAVQGPVTVRFIVDQEGSTSNVEAIDGPKELRDEAVRVIQRSGKWIPAIQNGRKVKSYKEQRIIFKLSE